MNKPVYLGLYILKINKILMYDFWYDYVKTKYEEKAKLCDRDKDKKQKTFTLILQKIAKKS